MDKKIKDLYDAVSLLYQKVAVRSQNAFDAGDDTKLNPVDVEAILFVGSNPNCIVSDLGNHLGVVPTTTSSIVERLVQRDVLSRLRTEKNRRIVILCLTERGEEIFAMLVDSRLEVMQQFLARLTAGERTTLSTLMEKLAMAEAPARQAETA